MSNPTNQNLKLRNLGIVMICLGLFCSVFAPLVSASIAIVIGVALVIVGALHVYHSITHGGPRKRIGILISLLTLLAGLFMIFKPMTGIMTLVQIAMLYFLIGGIFDIVEAFQIKPSKDWWVPLVMGALNIIFAVILISRADIAIWLLGLLVGVNLTIKGSIILMMSYND